VGPVVSRARPPPRDEDPVSPEPRQQSEQDKQVSRHCRHFNVARHPSSMDLFGRSISWRMKPQNSNPGTRQTLKHSKKEVAMKIQKRLFHAGLMACLLLVTLGNKVAYAASQPVVLPTGATIMPMPHQDLYFNLSRSTCRIIRTVPSMARKPRP
jgi:hypothetical protein